MTNNAKSAPTLGYALIGCGGAGRAHAGWAAATDGVAVRGFCDIHEGAAQQLQAQHGAEYATTDPERVFADPAVWTSFRSPPPTVHMLTWPSPPSRPASISSSRSRWP